MAQMMTHKYALPLAPGSRWKNQIPDGRLVYKDGTELARLNELDCPERIPSYWSFESIRLSRSIR